MCCQLVHRSLEGFLKPLTGNTRMIRIVVVLAQQAECHPVEEGVMGVPVTTARVCAARATETRM
jgi:hypothetical protein